MAEDQGDKVARIIPADPTDQIPEHLIQVSDARTDKYADIFNTKKAAPTPGWGYPEVALKLNLHTPGNIRHIFSAWIALFGQIWGEGLHQDSTFDAMRLFAHRPDDYFNTRIVQVFHVDTSHVFFFVPAPFIHDDGGNDVINIGYRIFRCEIGTDTFIELTPFEFVTVGPDQSRVMDAMVRGSIIVSVSLARILIIGINSDNEMISALSTDGGAIWVDQGVFDAGAPLGVFAGGAACCRDFVNSAYGNVFYEDTNGDVTSYAFWWQVSIFFVQTEVVDSFLYRPLSAKGPGFIDFGVSTGGRGAGISNDAYTRGQGNENLIVMPWADDAGNHGIVHNYSGGGIDPVRDVYTIAGATPITPVGIASRGRRIYASFFTPGTNTGALLVMSVDEIIGGFNLFTDETAGGKIPWPFTVPVGQTYRGGLSMYDNVLFMPYIREVLGELEYGIVYGTVDLTDTPIDGPTKISWVFEPMSHRGIGDWVPVATSQVSGKLTIASLQARSGNGSPNVISNGRCIPVLSVPPLGSTTVDLILETSASKSRVEVWPLLTYPAGGTVIDNTTRIASTRFEPEFDPTVVTGDANQHYFVRAETRDTSENVYDVAEFRMAPAQVADFPLNNYAIFHYSDNVFVSLNVARMIRTSGLMSTDVTDNYGGDYYWPDIAWPFAQSVNYQETTDGINIKRGVIAIEQDHTGALGHPGGHMCWISTTPWLLQDFVVQQNDWKFTEGGNWSVPGFRGRYDITFEISEAQIRLGNTLGNVSLTITLALIDIDSETIFHQFDTVTYAQGAGPNTQVTDFTTYGGTYTFDAAILPDSWRLATLSKVEFGGAKQPGGIAFNRDIRYQIFAMNVQMDAVPWIDLP